MVLEITLICEELYVHKKHIFLTINAYFNTNPFKMVSIWSLGTYCIFIEEKRIKNVFKH